MRTTAVRPGRKASRLPLTSSSTMLMAPKLSMVAPPSVTKPPGMLRGSAAGSIGVRRAVTRPLAAAPVAATTRLSAGKSIAAADPGTLIVTAACASSVVAALSRRAWPAPVLSAPPTRPPARCPRRTRERARERPSTPWRHPRAGSVLRRRSSPCALRPIRSRRPPAASRGWQARRPPPPPRRSAPPAEASLLRFLLHSPPAWRAPIPM